MEEVDDSNPFGGKDAEQGRTTASAEAADTTTSADDWLGDLASPVPRKAKAANAAKASASADTGVNIWHERLKTIRVLFSGIGALVCILFMVHGALILYTLRKATDFWDACHWVSVGAMCVLIGGLGGIFEVRTYWATGIATTLSRFAKYRLGLAFGYLWVGAYAMGGRIEVSGKDWTAASQATGVVSWCVAVANILSSCCVDPAASEPPAQVEGTAIGKENQQAAVPVPSKGPAIAGGGGGRSAPPPGAPPMDTFVTTDDTAAGNDLPASGWATVGDKPFGS